MKKKIVAVAYGARLGGGSFQYAFSVLETLASLPKDNYEVSFIYTSRDWDELLDQLGIKSSFVSIGGFFPRLLRRLLKAWLAFFPHSWFEKYANIDEIWFHILRAKPDVCVCLNQTYIPVCGKTKLVAPIHDIMHRYDARFPELGAVQEYIDREFVARHLVTEASVLVDSEVGKQQLLECYHCEPSRIYVLPFIPSSFLLANAKKPEALDLAPTARFVFCPAQFWPHKNHLGLLKALELLDPKLDIHAVLVGATEKEGFAAVADYITKSGMGSRVTVLGYVTDAEIKWLYQHAACMVLPSFCGPTNIPPIEAVQYGCPVATSKVYGNMEQLGDAALFFDPHNPEDLARCITSIMTDENVRTTLIEAGYALSKKWNAAAFKDRFRTILLDVICK